MPHFMAYSQLDGRPENRVAVEGHFDNEDDARLQLRYATRQRHGVIALPQDERVEDHGESEIDQMEQDLAGLESDHSWAECNDHDAWAAELEREIAKQKRAIAHARKERELEISG